MNHRVNAIVHRLPTCPECGAAELQPCTEHGRMREPHAIRLRVKSGETIIISAADARAARKLRAVRELVATIQTSRPAQAEKMKRALDVAVDNVRRAWGLNPNRRK